MAQKSKAKNREPTELDGPRKESLLEEAAAELNARGVTQTSLNVIAARLGVTRTALYYYVDDQRDLVFQCYRRSCEVLAQRFSRARQESNDALELLESFIDRMLAPDSPQIAVVSELSFLDDDRRDIISGLLSGIVADISGAIDRGIKAGTIRRCRSDVVARAVLGLVSWPLLLKRADPDLADRVAPNLAGAIKALLRVGVAAQRDSLVAINRSPDAPANKPIINIFEREAIVSAKQETLLAAGSTLLNAKGVDLTSLDEIAASVGVSKAVIYHNIGDKQTFVLECYRRALRIAFETADRMEAAQSDRITAFASAIYMDSILHLRDGAPIHLPMVGFAALPDTVAEELRNGGRRLLASYTRTMQAGQEEGTFRNQDFENVLTLLPSFSQWLTTWHERPGNELPDVDIAEEITQFICLGISPLGKSSP
ncbi:TetR/AcrR family transcriptional regulator [Hyphomonas oceanitis]|uniref:TetR/AcrR family transcriptional regulator n=1 Tax=Hyphomonas oceanitis TaxID=81033 RepID=UPI003002FD15